MFQPWAANSDSRRILISITQAAAHIAVRREVSRSGSLHNIFCLGWHARLSVCLHSPASTALYIVDAHFTHLSKVCMRDPRIVAQSPDPSFAQRNPRMVRIRALHITYTCTCTCIYRKHTLYMYIYNLYITLVRARSVSPTYITIGCSTRFEF